MEIDVRYSLNLLKKINSIEVKGKSISSHFIQSGKYSGWAFQQFFLLSQIKEFSKTKNFRLYKKKRQPRFSVFSKLATFSFDTVVLTTSVISFFYCLVLRPNIVLFCSDFLKPKSSINPRLSAVIPLLKEKRVNYVEILHVTTVRNFFKNILKRQHIAVYLESFNTLGSLITYFKKEHSIMLNTDSDFLRAFAKSEKEFVLSIVNETIENIQRNEVVATLLGSFLKSCGISSFISIDDARYMSEMLLACERTNVTSYIFQHSNFDYLVGLDSLPPKQYIFPDTFFTWNLYWFERIKDISPMFSFYASQVKVGGRPYALIQPKLLTRNNSALKENINVLIPYEVAILRRQIQPYIDAMLEDTRITVSFLLRGDFEKDLQITQYFGDAAFTNTHLRIVESQDKEHALKNADVVAGVYSGFLDEVIEIGIPVCIFETDYVNINRLDYEKFAMLINTTQDNLFDKLSEARDTPQTVLMERKSRISRGGGIVEKALQEILGETPMA